MKLTCCCGASIETDVPEFKLAMQTTLGEPRTIVDRFKADHAPCLERWRAEIHRRSDTLADLKHRHALMREFVNGAMSDIIPDICPKCHGMKVSGPYVKGQSLCMCECDEPIINRIIDARAKVEATGKAPGYIILGQVEFDRLNEEVKELDYRFYSINMEGFMIDGLRIVVDPAHESRIDVAALRPKAK